MSKRLDDCVFFANWCLNERLEPMAAAELIRLARRAHSAGTKECNTNEPGDKSRFNFTRAAGRIWGPGVRVEWDGLWPSCYRPDGSEVRIPDIG